MSEPTTRSTDGPRHRANTGCDCRLRHQQPRAHSVARRSRAFRLPGTRAVRVDRPALRADQSLPARVPVQSGHGRRPLRGARDRRARSARARRLSALRIGGAPTVAPALARTVRSVPRPGAVVRELGRWICGRVVRRGREVAILHPHRSRRVPGRRGGGMARHPARDAAVGTPRERSRARRRRLKSRRRGRKR